MQGDSPLLRVALWAVPLLLGIVVHEVAHGWVARGFGDPTAERAGRLTLNPVRHVDPVGTLLVPGVLLLVGGFVFGWAKPVPVVPANLRRPRRDMALVALAGPAANLVMALGWALVVRAVAMAPGPVGAVGHLAAGMGLAGVVVNTVLMVLNLIPLPPLDGGRVLSSLLPPRQAWLLARVERWGLLVLLALLASGILARVMTPAVDVVLQVLLWVAGVPPAVLGL